MSPSRRQGAIQLGLLCVAAVSALATSYRNPARKAQGKAELPAQVVLVGGPPLLRLVHAQNPGLMCGMRPGRLHVILGLRLGNRSDRPVTVDARKTFVEVDGRRFDPSEVRFSSLAQGGDELPLRSLDPGREAVIEVVLEGKLPGRRLTHIDRVSASIATSAGALKLTFKDLVRDATADSARPYDVERIDELHFVPPSPSRSDAQPPVPPPPR